MSQETKVLKRSVANPKIVLRFIEKHQPITLTTLLGALECREVKENFEILLRSNSIHVDHEEPVPGKLETLKFYAAGPSPDKQATEDYFGGLPPPRIDVKQFLAENPEPISTPPPPLPPPAIPEPESKSKSDEGKERVYDKNVLSWMKEVDNGQGKCVTAQQVADHFKITLPSAHQHLTKLVSNDLASRTRHGRNFQYYPIYKNKIVGKKEPPAGAQKPAEKKPEVKPKIDTADLKILQASADMCCDRLSEASTFPFDVEDVKKFSATLVSIVELMDHMQNRK